MQNIVCFNFRVVKASKRGNESAICLLWFILYFGTKLGKYCSIRHNEYLEFQTKIFGQMEKRPGLNRDQTFSVDSLNVTYFVIHRNFTRLIGEEIIEYNKLCRS